MMFIPALVNYYGAKKGLLLCGGVVGVRLILSGLTVDPLMISIIKPFYGVEIALLLISVFKYIAEHFHKRVNATMYLLGYQAMVYVGSVVVAPPAGYLYDKIGFSHGHNDGMLRVIIYPHLLFHLIQQPCRKKHLPCVLMYCILKRLNPRNSNNRIKYDW